MNLVLKLKVKATLGKDWIVHQDKSGYIFFKDRKQRANYSLYAVGMNQDQILKIAQIVGRVFAEIDKDNRLRTNHEVPTQNLNSTSELSQQYVARVLNLDGSDLHKLFLLASGAFLSSPGVDDILITLAESKKEDPDGMAQVENLGRVFEALQEIYILPGVSHINASYSAREIIRSATMRHSVEMVARLLSFVTSQAYGRTLSDHLSLNDESAYKAEKDLDMLDRFSFLEKFIARKIEYKELALKLNASQIYNLNLLMYSRYSNIPEDFLYNRAIAMRNKDITNSKINVSDYLSFRELSLTSSPDEMTKINKLTSEASPKLWPRTPIVYAAIGEVVVQKGYDRAIEVIKELSKASYLGENSREYAGPGNKYVEDTVLLILEALNPDNDEMPFSWAAQISEYGWVLNPQLTDEDLTLKV